MNVSKIAQQFDRMKTKLQQLSFLDPGIIAVTISLYVKLWYFTRINVIYLYGGAIATFVGLVLVLASFALLMKRFRIWYLFILDLVISSLLFANTLYINYYGSPITVYTFQQVSNLNGLGDSIFSTSKPSDYLFFLDLVVLLLVGVLPFFKAYGARRLKRSFLVYLACGIIAVSAMPMKLYLENGHPFREFTGKDNIARYSLLGHHILDVYSYVTSRKTLDDTEKQMITAWFQEKQEQYATVPVTASSTDNTERAFGKGKNLILIQVESLQNFVINKKVNGKEITPNLNRMLAHSLYFPNFYPQTIEGNSSDAEFLTQTSLYPISKGAAFFRYPSNQYFSLGNMLKEKGYSTIAIHADEAEYWNRDKVYPGLGLDTFKSIKDFKMDEEIGMGLSDGSMFHQSIEMLKQEKAPFYSFMITLTSHFPFDLPAQYRSLNLPADFDKSLLGGYIESVHYTDKAIGQFINELQKAGLLENSVVVLYGDHNGIFDGDKNQIEQFMGTGSISRERWIKEYLPVPFIIYNPQLEGEVIPVVGGQVDVFPTIASIMGANPEDTYYTLGRNLLDEQAGSAIIPKGDYSTSPSYFITQEKNITDLSEKEKKVIEVSNLIVGGDYFKEVRR